MEFSMQVDILPGKLKEADISPMSTSKEGCNNKPVASIHP